MFYNQFGLQYGLIIFGFVLLVVVLYVLFSFMFTAIKYMKSVESWWNKYAFTTPIMKMPRILEIYSLVLQNKFREGVDICSVGDIKMMCGLRPRDIDYLYYWDDQTTVSIKRITNDYYIINFPPGKKIRKNGVK